MGVYMCVWWWGGVLICVLTQLNLGVTDTHTFSHKTKSSNPLFCPLKGTKKAMGFKGVIPRFLFFPIGKNGAFAPEVNSRWPQTHSTVAWYKTIRLKVSALFVTLTTTTRKWPKASKKKGSTSSLGCVYLSCHELSLRAGVCDYG